MSSVSKLYMKLSGARSGEIQGGCEEKEHLNQIEIDDWTWSVTRSKKTESSTRTAPGRVANDSAEPSVFAFSKVMDSASTKMLNAMKSAELLTADITLSEHSGQYFDMSIALKKVRVTEYSIDAQGKGKGGSLEEKWVFNYETIEFSYLPTKQQGLFKVELKRDASASTDTPASANAEEMLTLASKMPKDEVKKLLPDIEKRAGTAIKGAEPGGAPPGTK